ncbi:Aste57867_12262 [Aphanomyces stellatus]|uniref:PRA1 family protein n=1 Tax=Aphanomyces stellatus TaxID=120398 RepID=A0A485KWG9_9STRA|nr:hypothetical protein As57867_012217 [Aphanomyces stellatus]VFT89115.1 Aste57867_12262 [Aphanomyces stellatus]
MGEPQRAEQRHKAAPSSVPMGNDVDDIKIHSIMGNVVSVVRQKIHVNAIRNVFLCMGTGEQTPFTLPTPPQMLPRLQHNFQFFLVNYVLLFVLVLFCVLVFHPWSLLCVLATSGSWIAFAAQRKYLQQMYKNGVKEEHVVYGMVGATVIVFAFFLLPSLLTATGVSGVLGAAHAFFRDAQHTLLVRTPSTTTTPSDEDSINQV